MKKIFLFSLYPLVRALTMELKARLSSLEHQINSLQSLLNKENYSKNSSTNENSQENLKNILMSKFQKSRNDLTFL